MPHDAPYRVEYEPRPHRQVEYSIYKTGEGKLVTGTDLAFMHHLVDLLNEEVHAKDVHR